MLEIENFYIAGRMMRKNQRRNLMRTLRSWCNHLTRPKLRPSCKYGENINILKYSYINVHGRLFHIFNALIIIFSRDNSEDQEILKEIRKATKSVNKSSVEQTATLRAWSEVNKLDVGKYRKQVEEELDEDKDLGDKGS